MDIDKVRERLDAEAINAPFVITDSSYPPIESGFTYNVDSWHSDMANYITGTKEQDKYIGIQLRRALDVMPTKSYPVSDYSKIVNSQLLSLIMMNIGGQVLENAIKNGLTIELLKELSDVNHTL